MSVHASEKRTPDAVERIVQWTAWVGGLSAAVGFFGPMFVGNSNLGPPVGLVLMLPLGAVTGALIGAFSVAKNYARLAIALVLGLSAAVGFFSPMFVGNSLLPPIVGLVLMLPLGAVTGALIGAFSVTKNYARLKIALIGSVWVVILILFVLRMYFMHLSGSGLL